MNSQRLESSPDFDRIYITNFALGANLKLRATRRPLEGLSSGQTPINKRRLDAGFDVFGALQISIKFTLQTLPWEPFSGSGRPGVLWQTLIREPDADPSSWRLQRTHTPDGLADSPG